jgi:hypothetical protein
MGSKDNNQLPDPSKIKSLKNKKFSNNNLIGYGGLSSKISGGVCAPSNLK